MANILSSLFKFCFKDSFPELGRGRELSKIFFEVIPIIRVNNDIEEEFKIMISSTQKENMEQKGIIIDKRIYELYDLTEKETKLINKSQSISPQ